MFQVDERVAPAGDAERNLTHLRESLLEQAPLPPRQIYATPVEEDDLESAAASYARTLQHTAGSPPVLDLAYLGLGSDGHTASLVPGDPVLEIPDRDVALTGVYQKRLRMTLTYPMLNRSRRILWLVTGEGKVRNAAALACGRCEHPGRADQSEPGPAARNPTYPARGSRRSSSPTRRAKSPSSITTSAVCSLTCSRTPSARRIQRPDRSAGESFFEPPGSEHLVSENASATELASMLAVFIADDLAELTTLD